MNICQSCKFYSPEANSRNELLLGMCHKHAPDNTGFPQVMSNWGCGDHLLNPEMLMNKPEEEK